MKRLVLLFLIAFAPVGCESAAAKHERQKKEDEQTFLRLGGEMTTACAVVVLADSVAQARANAMAAIRSSAFPSYSLKEMHALLDEANRSIAALKERVAFEKDHPQQAAEDAKAEASQRLKCEMAKRSMSIFMAGSTR